MTEQQSPVYVSAEVVALSQSKPYHELRISGTFSAGLYELAATRGGGSLPTHLAMLTCQELLDLADAAYAVVIEHEHEQVAARLRTQIAQEGKGDNQPPWDEVTQ